MSDFNITPDPTDASDLLASILLVDGTGSGLDTDLVRGVTPGTAGLALLAKAAIAVGSLLYGGAANSISELAAVATGNVLISAGVTTAPSWGKVGLATHVSGVLPSANGGTDQSSYAVGDLLYASGAAALSKLADIATGNALLSGGVTTAPLWGKIGLTTHISGVLAVSNGGTGLATLLAGSIAYGAGTSAMVDLAIGSANKVLTSSGSAPQWSAGLSLATLSLSGQLTSTLATGTAPFVVASTTNIPNLNASSLNGATFAAPGAIGGGTPSTGAFTTISATGVITSTLATGTAPFTVASTTVVANLNASQLMGATWTAPGTIGSGTPSTGAFTTISATGAITSTLATGTAPFTVASTTVVANLNVSQLLGSTWAVPGSIGATTPAAGAFTTLTANGLVTFTNTTSASAANTGAFVVGNGTVATSVAFGAGKINCGDSITAGASCLIAKSAAGAVLSLTIQNTGGGAGSSSALYLDDGTSHLFQILPDNNGTLTSIKAINRNTEIDIWTGTGVGAQRMKIDPTGLISTTNTTDASAIGTAAIVSVGGLSIAKSIWCAGSAGQFININNSTGLLKINSTQVISARKTGWTLPTATVSRAGFANGATTTQLEQTLSALIADLHGTAGHGLIGT